MFQEKADTFKEEPSGHPLVGSAEYITSSNKSIKNHLKISKNQSKIVFRAGLGGSGGGLGAFLGHMAPPKQLEPQKTPFLAHMLGPKFRAKILFYVKKLC